MTMSDIFVWVVIPTIVGLMMVLETASMIRIAKKEKHSNKEERNKSKVLLFGTVTIVIVLTVFITAITFVINHFS